MGFFKDLFIVDENAANKPTATEPVKKETTLSKFPTAAPTNSAPAESFSFPKVETQSFTPEPTPSVSFAPISSQVPNEYIEKALDVYEKGFESLNQPGFDFYEFFQSVALGGSNNPQVYVMAFQMAYGMDKSITKDKLVQQADFYLTEIDKVYQEYVGKGNGKKQELLTLKDNENKNLVSELDSMKQQLAALQIQIEDRQRKLGEIDTKYGPQLSEIENKISANNIANQKIVESIQHVKTGIISNLK
jgi:hypothetical protein